MGRGAEVRPGIRYRQLRKAPPGNWLARCPLAAVNVDRFEVGHPVHHLHPEVEGYRVGLNTKILEKARNFFNASLTDILNELLQNARRAGATLVTITLNPKTMALTVEDNGSGIFRDGIAIDLGGSGWDGTMQASEDPAGCGLFSTEVLTPRRRLATHGQHESLAHA